MSSQTRLGRDTEAVAGTESPNTRPQNTSEASVSAAVAASSFLGFESEAESDATGTGTGTVTPAYDTDTDPETETDTEQDHESDQEQTLFEDPLRGKVCLVTGGCGFLGRSIAIALTKRGAQVRIYDRIKDKELEDAHGIVCFEGDIRDQSRLFVALHGVDIVFHTAALTRPWAEYSEFHSTNVKGTEILLSSCVLQRVSALVYTSSAAVVFTGEDIINGDESLPYPEKNLDGYSTSKALAEQCVLAANGRNHLLTCALRPHLIFGPGDKSFLPRFINQAKRGQFSHIIGDGTNLVDFTFIDNAVHAHLLAASKLHIGSPICGRVYFISNSEPQSLWNFIGFFLDGLCIPAPDKMISYNVAYSVAYAMETVHWALSRVNLSLPPKLTRHTVAALATHHYFNISRAVRELGYSPVVSMVEAKQRTLFYLRSNAYLLNSTDEEQNGDFCET